MIIADNPTDEDQILECSTFRSRIPPHKAADFLLMPMDTACDFHNDVEYQSIPIPDVPIGVTVKDVRPEK